MYLSHDLLSGLEGDNVVKTKRRIERLVTSASEAQDRITIKMELKKQLKKLQQKKAAAERRKSLSEVVATIKMPAGISQIPTKIKAAFAALPKAPAWSRAKNIVTTLLHEEHSDLERVNIARLSLPVAGPSRTRPVLEQE